MLQKHITSATTLIFTILILSSRIAFADTTPPTTAYTMTPATPNGSNGWYVTPVRFDLTATDLESGVKEIRYRIDNGNWQSVGFSNVLNLVQNPSFENSGGTTTGIDKWEASVIDVQGSYAQDFTYSAPSYESASARITTQGGSWHGINNKNFFAVASPYENMTASVWMRPDTIAGQAYYKIFAIDALGNATQIAESTKLNGAQDWSQVSTNFSVNSPTAVGVYIDIGLTGNGSLWVDAVTINSANATPTTSVIVGSDNANHTLSYYSVDNSNNLESYSCTAPIKNCVPFKIDSTSPGNWRDSQGVRSQGSVHELYVYVTVDDATSGLSTNTNKYQYLTDRNPTFGRYQNLTGCNTTWQSTIWAPLDISASSNGQTTATVRTQRTDFCDSNWKVCKIVKFYAEDVAGNSSTKDICINGPWIQMVGKGVVRGNQNIQMIAEPVGENTDGLIEMQGNIIDFFSSSKGWVARSIPAPQNHSYDEFSARIRTKTTVTNPPSTTGAYLINGNFTASSSSIPNTYDNANFNQIVFINGNLRISNNITVSANSTALYIVKGNVEIEKNVTTVGVAILADGDFYTAFNISEGQTSQTLNFTGVYSAKSFIFQRTLQGTENNTSPSEIFNYAPKYAVQLKSFFGNFDVSWKSVN